MRVVIFPLLRLSLPTATQLSQLFKHSPATPMRLQLLHQAFTKLSGTAPAHNHPKFLPSLPARRHHRESRPISSWRRPPSGVPTGPIPSCLWELPPRAHRTSPVSQACLDLAKVFLSTGCTTTPPTASYKPTHAPTSFCSDRPAASQDQRRRHLNRVALSPCSRSAMAVVTALTS